MIVWLDGTFGVGKSTVASKIVEKLSRSGKSRGRGSQEG